MLYTILFHNKYSNCLYSVTTIKSISYNRIKIKYQDLHIKFLQWVNFLRFLTILQEALPKLFFGGITVHDNCILHDQCVAKI